MFLFHFYTKVLSLCNISLSYFTSFWIRHIKKDFLNQKIDAKILSGFFAWQCPTGANLKRLLPADIFAVRAKRLIRFSTSERLNRRKGYVDTLHCIPYLHVGVSKLYLRSFFLKDALLRLVIKRLRKIGIDFIY